MMKTATCVVESGSIFREEMREINLAGGFEYWYAKQFAFRDRLFLGALHQGQPQVLHLGRRREVQHLLLDLSYLIANTQQQPAGEHAALHARLQVRRQGARRTKPTDR